VNAGVSRLTWWWTVTLEASSTALEVAKLILLPAIGFLAGFAAQWLLQARKSRDELLRALAEPRAAALCKLWELTTLPNEITRLTEDAEVPRRVRASLDSAIVDWYTKQAGALYLSWPATQIVFRLLDSLRTIASHKSQIEAAVSALRSQLKYDCGIYSASELRRKLERPRGSPWILDDLARRDDEDG
jgi:hypothetical protein